MRRKQILVFFLDASALLYQDGVSQGYFLDKLYAPNNRDIQDREKDAQFALAIHAPVYIATKPLYCFSEESSQVYHQHYGLDAIEWPCLDVSQQNY